MRSIAPNPLTAAAGDVVGEVPAGIWICSEPKWKVRMRASVLGPGWLDYKLACWAMAINGVKFSPAGQARLSSRVPLQREKGRQIKPVVLVSQLHTLLSSLVVRAKHPPVAS